MPFNPERINIKDLTIEEPEKKSESFFDIEKEITEEDWRMAESLLEDLQRKAKSEKMSEAPLSNLFLVARAMKVIWPDKSVALQEDNWRLLQKKVNIDDYSYSIVEKILFLASSAKIIDPGRKIQMNERRWQTIEKLVEGLRREKDQNGVRRLQEMLANIKIVDPDKISPLESDAEKGKEALDEYITQMRQHDPKTRDQSRDNILKVAPSIKLIDPQFSIDLSPNEWGDLGAFLSEQRTDSGYFINFLNTAMELKMLAAQNIKMTDNGLEITMPQRKEELKAEASEMPEQRKF